MSDVLRIDPSGADGRFARFELIEWWDQERLASARVLLVGVGALGNEILKNLALLGVGQVFVADLDAIEEANLSRSILFRAQDCGRPKASVAVASARRIFPAMNLQPFRGNIVYDLGLGVFGWADVILAGLDNREARVAINRAASRMGKVWIDGAIERLGGVARVFDPLCGPCYECTMNDTDWKMLEARRSCALLTREEMELGKVPTTPTTASVVAGIQCQEALKFLHGLDSLVGKGFVFDGAHHQSYVISYEEKPGCPAHEPYEPLETLSLRTAETSVGKFLERVRSDLGGTAVIETNTDLLKSLRCTTCDEEQRLLASLGKITEEQGRCPRCGEQRIPQVFHTVKGDEDFLDRSLADIGVPPWDVLGGRAGMKQRFYEFAGDRGNVLGPLLQDE